MADSLLALNASCLALKQQLQCPLCHRLYGREDMLLPKILRCGHTYCLQCVLDYWRHESKICSQPFCRKIFDPSFDSDDQMFSLQTNKQILDAAEAFRSFLEVMKALAINEEDDETIAAKQQLKPSQNEASSLKTTETAMQTEILMPDTSALTDDKAQRELCDQMRHLECKEIHESANAVAISSKAQLVDSSTAGPVVPSTRKRLTLLLLGETGSGKSTCINAIANYIRHESMNDALTSSDLTYVIPTKFYISTDDTYEQECIQVGASPNECFESGKSATLKPQVYFFNTKKYEVFLIDTPGIGDSEGIEQDKRNMNEILGTLASYPTINAICLVMKANNARLSVNLSYCLSELLLRLHREAVDNIYFFFTNSRGSYYKPGDSKTTLTTFLNRLNKARDVRLKMTKENVFCVDNEAYRLVCASHQGIKFNKTQKRDYERSWSHSVKEIFRLLDQAAANSGLDIQKTLSLNNACKIIFQLAKPLAETLQLNEDNISIAWQHSMSIQHDYKNDLEGLKKNLWVPREEFVVEQLPNPITVCTSSKCVEKCQVLNSKRRLQTYYKQICHNPCTLPYARKERYPERALKQCSVMDKSGNCKMCGCNWSTHMQIYYRQQKKLKIERDHHVQQAIDRVENVRKAQQILKAQTEARIQTLKGEQTSILTKCAIMAKFLQECAIIPYEDVFKQHLERIIEEERRISDVSDDQGTLSSLQACLIDYEEFKRQEGLPEVTPEDVHRAKEMLFALPSSGSHLRQLYEETERGEEHNAFSFVVRMESRWDSLAQSAQE